ncbi:hypothetical protein [Sulfitobacter sp.]|uniref:hypothetical protein n=1 Tax=Sulfitobacter sp. TaxID=1903071 RepID=UPI003F6D8F16
MNIATLSLFAIDLLSIGIVFWLVPDAVARLVRGRLQNSGPRPIRFLVDQLPGLVVGTVFGAVVLYFTGVSYENFIVNTGKAIGNTALEVMGLDEMALCKQRVVMEHFPATSELQFREAASNFQDDGSPTLQAKDGILMRGQMYISIDGGAPNIMERSIESHCNFMIERGLFER